jgi:hypothetical protein
MSTTNALRDNSWLEDRLQHLWTHYYNDVPVGYPITITFGPRARYRYGSIYSKGRRCYILINRLFAHPNVPEYVVDATIAHELAHYVHGYGSGLRKLHAHPHRGGVVDKEMEKRGCFFLEERAGDWRRNCWQEFYITQSPDVVARQAAREKQESTRWEMYLSTPGFRTEAGIQDRATLLAARFGLSDVPFKASWLYASPRRNGLSYRFQSEGTVKIHGVLADRHVPDYVIDYELSYWLAVGKVGGNWPDIEQAMKDAGVWPAAQKAIQWRRKVWPNYYLANHPFKAK